VYNMEFPITVKVSFKLGRNSDTPPIPKEVVLNAVYDEILTKIRSLNLIEIQENSNEVTGKADFIITKRYKVT